MTSYSLGIDYGTSHTVAILSRPGGTAQTLLFDGSPLLPSTVYADSGGRLLAGPDALRAGRSDPGRTEPNPKRRIGAESVLLGDDAHPVADLVAATLRMVADEAARVAGRAPDTVTLACPAEWSTLRRGVLTEAARRAGLPAAVLVPEPVSAARYFAARPDTSVGAGDRVVVYDLGAGTCDVSVVERTGAGFEVLAIGGRDDVGGLDLDAVIVEAIGRTLATAEPEVWRRLTASDLNGDLRHRRALWTGAREAKESLSRRSSALVEVPIAGRDVLVGREEFEAGARPLLTATAELTARVIAESASPAGRIAGLFLVGGASRTPLVATLLHQATGIAPTVLDQPELVVAEGCLVVTAPTPARPASAPRREAAPEAAAARPEPGPAPARSAPTGTASVFRLRSTAAGYASYAFLLLVRVLAIVTGLAIALTVLAGEVPPAAMLLPALLGVFTWLAPPDPSPGAKTISLGPRGITIEYSNVRRRLTWSRIDQVAYHENGIVITVDDPPPWLPSALKRIRKGPGKRGEYALGPFTRLDRPGSELLADITRCSGGRFADTR